MQHRKPSNRPLKCALALCLALALVLSLSANATFARKKTRKHSQHSSTTSKNHATSKKTSKTHRTRHHAASRTKRHTTASKTRYAYPLDLFMLSPPAFDKTPLSEDASRKLRQEFDAGIADGSHPNDLVRAGIVIYHPLHGGIFKRRQPVKYIIVHSTETGPPVSAVSVINAWSSLGRRHAGAQYVVERDGRIYQSCEPDLATVHVNIFKTLPGINNDNSIGIEMNHTGKQTYPAEQRLAVTKLVTYLQERYHVLDADIITHRYAQQGDHTDPVLFDFEAFLMAKDEFHGRALATKRQQAPPANSIADIVAPEPTVYLQMHKTIPEPGRGPEVAADSAFKQKEHADALLPHLRTEIELTPDRVTIEQQQMEEERRMVQQQNAQQEQEQEQEQIQLEPHSQTPALVP